MFSNNAGVTLNVKLAKISDHERALTQGLRRCVLLHIGEPHIYTPECIAANEQLMCV